VEKGHDVDRFVRAAALRDAADWAMREVVELKGDQDSTFRWRVFPTEESFDTFVQEDQRDEEKRAYLYRRMVRPGASWYAHGKETFLERYPQVACIVYREAIPEGDVAAVRTRLIDDQLDEIFERWTKEEDEAQYIRGSYPTYLDDVLSCQKPYRDLASEYAGDEEPERMLQPSPKPRPAGSESSGEPERRRLRRMRDVPE